ncbi:MAG: hypothetical protein JWO83_150 [Caulobacteraceae bacterium]|nr:hypothetical protein [Caulobacteraceae bacterium]
MATKVHPLPRPAHRYRRYPRPGASDNMGGSNAAVPAWELRFPGRFRFELDELAAAGAKVAIHPGPLADGLLVLDLLWPRPAGVLNLRAVYPESFPFFRPSVHLLDRPFPTRHCRQTDGLLCLLGRNTGQWQPNLSLRQLLAEQLELALTGTPDEDPQGEPAEMWWNGYGLPGSYVLVDSDWRLGSARSGTLTIAYRVLPEGPTGPRVQAVVLAVMDDGGHILGELSSPPPPSLDRRADIPWVRIDDEFVPTAGLEDLSRQIAGTGLGKLMARIELKQSQRARLGAIVHVSELQQGALGLGWLFPMEFGPPEAFRLHPGRKAKSTSSQLGLLRTFRAGTGDIGFRIPALQGLRGKRVAVIGLGAIGAPIVLSLARNRCGELHMLDFDVVEPGTDVRWVRGASAWGVDKLEALMETLAADYPATRGVPHKRNIGSDCLPGESEAVAMERLVAECDLVIDATASYGVAVFLADVCRRLGVSLVTAYATPSVEGGVVAILRPEGGCPTCLEHSWHGEQIVRPPGPSEGGLTQPPGCAEPTFFGADFDLQEISMQAVRAAVRELLSPGAPTQSDVLTLDLRSGSSGYALPTWRHDPLPHHSACSCRPAN